MPIRAFARPARLALLVAPVLALLAACMPQPQDGAPADRPPAAEPEGAQGY